MGWLTFEGGHEPSSINSPPGAQQRVLAHWRAGRRGCAAGLELWASSSANCFFLILVWPRGKSRQRWQCTLALRRISGAGRRPRVSRPALCVSRTCWRSCPRRAGGSPRWLGGCRRHRRNCRRHPGGGLPDFAGCIPKLSGRVPELSGRVPNHSGCILEL